MPDYPEPLSIMAAELAAKAAAAVAERDKIQLEYIQMLKDYDATLIKYEAALKELVEARYQLAARGN